MGNAVAGIPVGEAHKIYRTAAFGGRNAGDGVPYDSL